MQSNVKYELIRRLIKVVKFDRLTGNLICLSSILFVRKLIAKPYDYCTNIDLIGEIAIAL